MIGSGTYKAGQSGTRRFVRPPSVYCIILYIHWHAYTSVYVVYCIVYGASYIDVYGRATEQQCYYRIASSFKVTSSPPYIKTLGKVVNYVGRLEGEKFKFNINIRYVHRASYVARPKPIH